MSTGAYNLVIKQYVYSSSQQLAKGLSKNQDENESSSNAQTPQQLKSPDTQNMVPETQVLLNEQPKHRSLSISSTASSQTSVMNQSSPSQCFILPFRFPLNLLDEIYVQINKCEE